MDTAKIVLSIIGAVAVPLIAFLVRLLTGDTGTDDEKTISNALRAWMESRDHPLMAVPS